MASGLLSLKWNHHKSTFIHVLSSIRRKESYSDVTIACDGKFYPVHKLVLSTCSEYFEEMFTRTECKHPVIVLKDIDADDFEALLNYMYVGEVNVLQEKLSSLIKAAEGLRIKGLAVADEEPTIRETPHKRTQNCSSPQAKRRRNDDLDAFRDEQQPRRRRESSSSVEHQQNNEQINCNSTVNKANPAIVPTSSPDESTEDNTALHQNNSPDNTQAEEAINEILLEEGAVKNEPVDPDDNDSKDFYVSDLSPDINQSPMQNPSTSGTWDDGGANQSDSTSGVSGYLIYLQNAVHSEQKLQGNNVQQSSQGCDPNQPKQDNMPRHRKILYCPICNKKCNSKAALNYHVKTHSRDKDYACTLCSYKCITRTQLEQHFNQHSGGRVFSCPFCDYKCALKSNLDNHMKKHFKDLPFSCQQCPFRAASDLELKDHFVENHMKHFMEANMTTGEDAISSDAN